VLDDRSTLLPSGRRLPMYFDLTAVDEFSDIPWETLWTRDDKFLALNNWPVGRMLHSNAGRVMRRELQPPFRIAAVLSALGVKPDSEWQSLRAAVEASHADVHVLLLLSDADLHDSLATSGPSALFPLHLKQVDKALPRNDFRETVAVQPAVVNDQQIGTICTSAVHAIVSSPATVIRDFWFTTLLRGEGKSAVRWADRRRSFSPVVFAATAPAGYPAARDERRRSSYRHRASSTPGSRRVTSQDRWLSSSADRGPVCRRCVRRIGCRGVGSHAGCRRGGRRSARPTHTPPATTAQRSSSSDNHVSAAPYVLVTGGLSNTAIPTDGPLGNAHRPRHCRRDEISCRQTGYAPGGLH
jgi:hypothetical protein